MSESLLACQFFWLLFSDLNMVDVVQLAEHRIVVPGVVGSSPITHPIKRQTDRSVCLLFILGR